MRLRYQYSNDSEARSSDLGVGITFQFFTVTGESADQRASEGGRIMK